MTTFLISCANGVYEAFWEHDTDQVLTLVALLDETYPRELARLTGAPLASVQRIVNDLEREGVVATRIVGANREVSLNPDSTVPTSFVRSS